MEEINEKPLVVLEEQLTRQQKILANSNLLRNLPDKGAKLKESVATMEAELNRRKEDLATREMMKKVPDVTKLEWALSSTLLSASTASSFDDFGRSEEKVSSNDELNNDDNIDETEGQLDNEKIFKMIATSQISQRQVKPVTNDNVSSIRSKESQVKSKLRVIEVKPDPYLANLVEKDERKKSQESKFVPAKSLKSKYHGSSSSAESSYTSEGSCYNKKKWDEALLPTKSSFDGLKMLSMHDTIEISCEKYKQAEVVKATALPKKLYAYDKLMDQGLLSSYTLELQTSRPVQSDLEAVDDFEDDLSHDDSITDESEISDGEDENHKYKEKSRKQTGNDLSVLLNASLKLNTS